MTNKVSEVKPSALKICKVVYFDEGSVTDYVQIMEGGRLNKTIELLKHEGEEYQAGIEGSASIGIKSLFQALIKLNADIGVSGKVATSAKEDELAKSILQNTILTDFLEMTSERKHDFIKVFHDYKISSIQNSMGSYMLLTPYMSMIRSNKGIKIDNMPNATLAIERIEDAMRSAKGYFEMKASPKTGESSGDCIFRFNIQAFRNNYKMSDLSRMDLIVYAVQVGKVKLEELNIEIEMNPLGENMITKTNPKYSEIRSRGKKDSVRGKDLPMYDVLLAGITGRV